MASSPARCYDATGDEQPGGWRPWISGSPPAATPTPRDAHSPTRRRRHCPMVNSGSSANLIAFSGLCIDLAGRPPELKPGDEVITVAAGFPTTSRPAIVHVRGCARCSSTSHPETVNIDVRPAGGGVQPRTRAVMVAHTLGNPFDLDAVRPFLPSAQPVPGGGQLRRPRVACTTCRGPRDTRTGTFGDLATISFYPAHHMTMGEGGARSPRPAAPAIVESFRDWGRDCYCEPGKDNTCGKRSSWQLGDAALRLRPQVHLLALGLQPEDHRPAGRSGAGAGGQTARFRGRPGAPTTLFWRLCSTITKTKCMSSSRRQGQTPVGSVS